MGTAAVMGRLEEGGDESPTGRGWSPTLSPRTVVQPAVVYVSVACFSVSNENIVGTTL